MDELPSALKKGGELNGLWEQWSDADNALKAWLCYLKFASARINGGAGLFSARSSWPALSKSYSTTIKIETRIHIRLDRYLHFVT
jgi:hypothetical protein